MYYSKVGIKKNTSPRKHFLLHSSDSSLLKAYALPKIHKLNVLFRIIISINTALYPLANFIYNIVSENLIFNTNHVNNSFELYKSLWQKKFLNQMF